MEAPGPDDPVIPGSEIRGMFRSHYEILTNSCLSIVDEDKDVVPAKRTNEVFSAGLIRKNRDGSYSLYEAEDCLLRTTGENGPEMGRKEEKHCGHVFTNPGNRVRGNFDLKVLETALEEYTRTSNTYSEYKRCLNNFRKNAEVGEYFPVYYSRLNGSDYIYLSPASITREIYQKKMSDLLGQYAPCKDKSALCPACSLFGTVGKDAEGKMFSSASRVRFTDLHLKEGSRAEYRKTVTLKELSSPKLSNTEFYLKRPSDNAWFWTYDYYVDDRGNVCTWDAEINGRKFYWHKGEADLPGGVEITERNITVRPLKEGRLFSGKVYFEHISKAELDRLIFLNDAGIMEKVKENFLRLTSFDAVDDGKFIQYPTTGMPGTDGNIRARRRERENRMTERSQNRSVGAVRMRREKN